MSNSKENSPVVLQVLPELEMGGVERGTVEIATYMQQHGIKNFVASQGGRMVYDLEKAKVPHLTLPQPLLRGGQGFYIPCHQNAF